jgi:DNA-binding MarR family transcriptional regulator
MFDIDDCVASIATNAGKKIADNFNEKLKNEGITRVQWIALFYLGKYDSLNQYELGKKMKTKSSTVVRLVDRMEKQGYIIRKKDSEDRRLTFVELTPKGRDMREKLIPLGNEFHMQVKNGIDCEELKIFKKVLNQMIKNVCGDEN